MKFLKRAAETFGQNHGIQLTITSDSGARISTGEMGKCLQLITQHPYVGIKQLKRNISKNCKNSVFFFLLMVITMTHCRITWFA